MIRSDVNFDPQTSKVNGHIIAHQGDGPTAVLNTIHDVINNIDINGLVILLSSGTSNNPAQTGVVPAQIKALKDAGATVGLVGVSNGYNQSGFQGTALNQTLKTIAEQAGVKFIGGFDGSGPGLVHPGNYHALLQQAITAFA